MSYRLVLPFLLAALTAGCSSPSTSPLTTGPAVLQIAPTDGATAVRLDAGVTLDFGVAVDRGVVESGLHLVSEADMSGPCPVDSMGPHGSMDSMMDDPDMLAHVVTMHATHGTFAWRNAGTSCVFQPDSLMQAQTRYMVHMSGAMLDMMSRMGGSMGGMMGGGQMTGEGHMVAHFTTMASDGHAEHHP